MNFYWGSVCPRPRIQQASGDVTVLPLRGKPQAHTWLPILFGPWMGRVFPADREDVEVTLNQAALARRAMAALKFRQRTSRLGRRWMSAKYRSLGLHSAIILLVTNIILRSSYRSSSRRNISGIPFQFPPSGHGSIVGSLPGQQQPRYTSCLGSALSALEKLARQSDSARGGR